MSANKYHVTKSGKVEPCLATSRQCPLVQFTVEAHNGEIKVISLPNKEISPGKEQPTKARKGSIPPATAEEQLRYEPTLSTLNEGLGFNFREAVVGFDSTGVPVTQKALDAIDLSLFLARIHGSDAHEVPSSLVAYADSKGFGDPNNYDVKVEGGYYGELDYFAVHKNPAKFEKFFSELTDRYWALPSRVDMDRVLPYLRSKGSSTAGLNPIEALKKQLAEENPGRSNTFVDSAKTVVSRRVSFDQVEVPNPKHYASVRARAPKSSVEGAPEIVGVVARKGFDKYVLVDGYHRFKYSRQLGQSRSGQFLVIY